MQVGAVNLKSTRAHQTRKQPDCRSGHGGRQNGTATEHQPERHGRNGSQRYPNPQTCPISCPKMLLLPKIKQSGNYDREREHDAKRQQSWGIQ